MQLAPGPYALLIILGRYPLLKLIDVGQLYAQGFANLYHRVYGRWEGVALDMANGRRSDASQFCQLALCLPLVDA